MKVSKLLKFSGVGIFILQLILIYVLFTSNFQEVSIETLGNEEESVEDVTPYLHVEEIVHVTETVDTKKIDVSLPIEKVLFEYVEVVDGCGPHFEGECLLVRKGPGTDFPKVSRLRNGMVLKISGKVKRNDTFWYKIIFDEWLRYPERVAGDWYVSADYVEVLLDEGDKVLTENTLGGIQSNKKIVVDRSEQTLYVYDGEVLFSTSSISTGLALTPTPRGTFTIYKKTPSRYMQGPLPNINDTQYYDLPGVPWNLYFTEGGAVIHGAYWHNSFGSPYSHGCVNVPTETARRLYTWADIGTTVIVQD